MTNKYQYGQSFAAADVLAATRAEAADADADEVIELFNPVADRLGFDKNDRDNYRTNGIAPCAPRHYCCIVGN